MSNTCLVLTQSGKDSKYNDFVGRLYHFPEKYLGHFKSLPLDCLYYDTVTPGEGVYFGCGKILSPPSKDKRERGQYFVEVSDYKPFIEPVSSKKGSPREAQSPHYNLQNAVRKISAILFEEICLDGKVRLNFRADAHLVKVLGEQLIASEKVGILELIKNAYDAGASYCRVRIESLASLPAAEKSEYLFPTLPGPVIVVEDDGSGMTRDVIENGWLRPASTIKTVVKENIKREREKADKEDKLGSYAKLIAEIRKEHGGRIPLGEKGVGRFASHRLGRRLLLKTKISKLDYEYVLEVDWDKFDASAEETKDLEAVGISLSRQAPSRDYGKKQSGTQLVIYGGREGFLWDKKSVEDVHRSIVSLNSPHPESNSPDAGKGFRAYLECPQITDLSSRDLAAAFPPVFSFDGIVDDDGKLEYSLKFQPPKTVPMPPEMLEPESYDLRTAETAYWLVDGDRFRNPECGPFYIHLDVWYRRDPWITGPDAKDFIDYLTSFGGISIFRDKINIFSAEWGAVTDWLNLNKRHIKRGLRMSYYNMIGNLELDQSKNIALIDKTNREGLIDNRAFRDLTQLVYTIITTVIENRFIGKRDDYNALTGEIVRDPKVLRDYARQGAALVTAIKEKYPIQDDPYDILRSVGRINERGEGLINLTRSLKNLQKSIDLMQEAQDLLTEQAGYGLAVAVSVHEIAKITANFYMGVSHLLKSDKLDVDKLYDLKEASASLQSELKRLGPLRAIKTEIRSVFSVTKAIGYVVEIFRSRLQKAGINAEVDTKDSFQLYTRYGAVVQIFSNLFDNSCYWLGTMSRRDRKIRLHIDSSNRTVTVADSGPGIDEVIFPYLFKIGYSMKVPPSGLGLYICKYYMQNMNGDAYVTHEREKIPDMTGAQFTLDFVRVPAEKVIEQKKL
jgi:signal transduction histidine kinase